MITFDLSLGYSLVLLLLIKYGIDQDTYCLDFSSLVYNLHSSFMYSHMKQGIGIFKINIKLLRVIKPVQNREFGPSVVLGTDRAVFIVRILGDGFMNDSMECVTEGKASMVTSHVKSFRSLVLLWFR